MKSSATKIRLSHTKDRVKVLSILRETNFFRPVELKIAEEVFDDAVLKGPDGDYQSFVVEENNRIIGWVCFGPTPCTVGTFDIYWLVVAAQKQRRGVGASLVRHSTNLIKACNGRMIVVETSGSTRYLPTRQFYKKMGYRKAGQIKDFYAPGDDKIIYVKSLKKTASPRPR